MRHLRRGASYGVTSGDRGGIRVRLSPQTLRLRKLLYHAETLQSHVLHAYFLAAPDFLGVGSVVPLAATHTEVVLRALKLKKLTNDLADALCGRKVHPISRSWAVSRSSPAQASCPRSVRSWWLPCRTSRRRWRSLPR